MVTHTALFLVQPTSLGWLQVKPVSRTGCSLISPNNTSHCKTHQNFSQSTRGAWLRYQFKQKYMDIKYCFSAEKCISVCFQAWFSISIINLLSKSLNLCQCSLIEFTLKSFSLHRIWGAYIKCFMLGFKRF